MAIRAREVYEGVAACIKNVDIRTLGGERANRVDVPVESGEANRRHAL